MGTGLDRLCMLAKGLRDIRMLDSPDPKARAQTQDLSPWRDLWVCCVGDLDAEAVVDRAAPVAEPSGWFEAIDVLGSWTVEELPRAALARLGLRENQRHWLLRRYEGSIERAAAEALARACWDALHEGSSLVHLPLAA